MKSRTKLSTINNNKPLTIDSRAKIYVPITIAGQNPPQPQPQQQHPNSTGSDHMITQLKRVNSELKQKQEIYIDKLIKLEQGLEKQHVEFKQLQDLYNQLLRSYKKKQEQICELQQNYRESNRKRESNGNQYSIPQLSKVVEQELKKQIEDQKTIISKLEYDLSQSNGKINELMKNNERLFSENVYYKNKDKMNDSRASLNSKVFEELGEWQRQADIQKEEKIKLDYENKFLKNRNQDLENRVEELEQILAKKQAEVLKLRQNNIVLSRENSESRLQRSSSRSPVKAQQKQNSGKKSPTKTSRIIDQLYEQNKMLKKELQKQKQNSQTIKTNNEHFIRQEQFFSFSQEHEGHSNHSSNQSGRNINKELFIKIETNYQVNKTGEKEEQKRKSSPILQAEELNNSDESLQQLPAELEIDNLIMRNKVRQNHSP